MKQNADRRTATSSGFHFLSTDYTDSLREILDKPATTVPLVLFLVELNKPVWKKLGQFVVFIWMKGGLKTVFDQQEREVFHRIMKPIEVISLERVEEG